MSTFYKATRTDGTSFYDQKTRWVVGETTSLPEGTGGRLCGPGVLHAATVPTETLVGGSWPCRLYEVEGAPLGLDYSGHAHKRGFSCGTRRGARRGARWCGI